MNVKELAENIVQRAQRQTRFIVAIAGPPGAGKSTIAEKLNRHLIEAGHVATIVPMDGFHLDNADLDKLGLRERKGSPETFDIEGFVDLVEKLRENKRSIQIPGFDRQKDQVVADHNLVEQKHRILLIEGNYLLLNSKPWKRLAELFDLTIFINPGIKELERRLVQRWVDDGHTEEQALARANSNDIPNAKNVILNSTEADIVLVDER